MTLREIILKYSTSISGACLSLNLIYQISLPPYINGAEIVMPSDLKEKAREINEIIGGSNEIQKGDTRVWRGCYEDVLLETIESALKEIREETIEECAKLAENIAMTYIDQWEESCHDAVRCTADEVAINIRARSQHDD